MSETQYTVQDILKAIGRGIARVSMELGDPSSAPAYTLLLLRRLGWNVQLDVSLRGGATAALEAAAAIEALVAGEDVDLVELATAMSELLSSMRTIGADLDVALR